MEKKIVVTGAGDSVGRLIAEEYQALGAKVHICDVRMIHNLQEFD